LASKDKAFYSKKTLKVNGKVIDLSISKIMGILNITDDSFFDGGRYINEKSISIQAEKMIKEGAEIIDIGGYSSRPGAQNIDEKMEFERVKTGIKAVQDVSKLIPLSIDTFRSGIAKKSLDLGASIINDISAGELDKKMFGVIAEYKAPYIMMHMKGSPKNMMNNIEYADLLDDIINYFVKKLEELTQIGIKDVIIDVGFGFSKTIDQNYDLLNSLELFKILNAPILAGISRKSMIYKVLKTSPDGAINGTTVLNTVVALKGADILRVHDVKEAREIIDLIKYINH
jgi:dihydropteroate synthase